MTPGAVPHQRPSLVGQPGPTRGQIPAWPEVLIPPNGRELARWTELWRLPQAKVWTRRGQERAVATLVRLEQRSYQARRPCARCAAELGLLRRELGLMTLV
jgi:hypothetical protein